MKRAHLIVATLLVVGAILVFFPPISPNPGTINEAGELLDRFDTPYFFHPISSKHIEIRSAGPNQKIGNNDDILLD